MNPVTQILHCVTSGDQNRKFWADYLSWNDGLVIFVIVSVIIIIAAYYWFRVRK